MYLPIFAMGDLFPLLALSDNEPRAFASLDVLWEELMLVGLTGGIGSGESAAADRFAELGDRRG